MTKTTTIIRLICDLIDGPGHEKYGLGQWELGCAFCEKAHDADSPCPAHAIALCDEAIKGLEEMGAKEDLDFDPHEPVLWTAIGELSLHVRELDTESANYALACLRRYRELLEEKSL